jgi:hypothetical protein
METYAEDGRQVLKDLVANLPSKPHSTAVGGKGLPGEIWDIFSERGVHLTGLDRDQLFVLYGQVSDLFYEGKMTAALLEGKVVEVGEGATLTLKCPLKCFVKLREGIREGRKAWPGQEVKARTIPATTARIGKLLVRRSIGRLAGSLSRLEQRLSQ